MIPFTLPVCSLALFSEAVCVSQISVSAPPPLRLCIQVTDGVVDAIVYPSTTDKNRNRGFAFVEYESHKAAAMARRKLIPGSLPPPPPRVSFLTFEDICVSTVFNVLSHTCAPAAFELTQFLSASSRGQHRLTSGSEGL